MTNQNLSPDQFYRRKVSPGVRDELHHDMTSARADDFDPGYRIDGNTLEVGDHREAVSLMDSRRDILEDNAEFGDRGAGHRARALRKVVDEVRAHGKEHGAI